MGEGRGEEGERGRERRRKGYFLSFIISSGCVHLKTASEWNP